MAEGRETLRSSMDGIGWSFPSFGTPLSLLADINGRLLQSMASAQRDWADFVHRRVTEDVVLSQQLMSCQSLADMHEVYSRYLRRALEQYQEQSQRASRRLGATAGDVAEAAEARASETEHRAHH